MDTIYDGLRDIVHVKVFDIYEILDMVNLINCITFHISSNAFPRYATYGRRVMFVGSTRVVKLINRGIALKSIRNYGMRKSIQCMSFPIVVGAAPGVQSADSYDTLCFDLKRPDDTVHSYE